MDLGIFRLGSPVPLARSLPLRIGVLGRGAAWSNWRWAGRCRDGRRSGVSSPTTDVLPCEKLRVEHLSSSLQPNSQLCSFSFLFFF